MTVKTLMAMMDMPKEHADDTVGENHYSEADMRGTHGTMKQQQKRLFPGFVKQGLSLRQLVKHASGSCSLAWWYARQ